MKRKKMKAPARRGPIADSDADLTDEHLISVDQTCEMLGGCSRMHLWRLTNDHAYQALDFPLAITIGKVGRHARKYFRIGDVKRWIAKRAALINEHDRAA